MSDPSHPRQPRDDGAEDQGSLSHQLLGWLTRVLGGRGDTSLREAVSDLLEESEPEAESSISPGERMLLTSVLKLRDRVASDVMIPRADIVAVQADISLDNLVRRFAEDAHSRLPVYRDTLDDVLGMVHLKDIVAALADHRTYDLTKMIREVLIVAPSVKVLDLLLQMRQTRHHMALVVDEFGGIDGLISIEDLVEEIVGEIEDEHDEEHAPRLIARPDGTLLADARMALEEFQAEVGPVLQGDELEDVDTLGGLVFSLAGRVPVRGELLKHPSGLEFEVVDADPGRIKRLRVRNLPAVRQRLADAANSG
jgi:magnesium and cobalt transporter